MSLSRAVKQSSDPRRTTWFERFMAILAVVNLVLVFFNLTYIPLRTFYVRVLPLLTRIYDPVKGIEPHPETQIYLDTVNNLEAQIVQTSLSSEETEELLEELQTSSDRLITDNPFEGTYQTNLLEGIKSRLRDRVGEDIASEAFTTFWSPAYLERTDWQQEISFFNTEIRPLVEANYSRNIGRFGNIIDYFWLLDLPFIIIFALDILARTYYTSRRKPQLRWGEAILRRWYDIFLILPFWRWLRVIPVTIRLYQTDLLDLEPARKQINYNFVVAFAEDIVQLVGVEAIEQMQDSIQEGAVARWLFHSESHHSYIDINRTNEVYAIANRVVNISVYDVLPQVQPDIEALIYHTIEKTLNQSAFYRHLQDIPGLTHLPNQLAETLAKNLSNAIYNNLTEALEDPVGAELTARLIKNFTDNLEDELQKKHNLEDIEALLVDKLEEIKINYVKRAASGGVAKFSEKADKLHELTRPRNQ